MNFVITDPSEEEIRYVAINMREKSRDDLFQSGDDLGVFADFMAQSPGFKWLIYHNNHPAVVLMAREEHKGVFTLFGFGTDDWIKVWRLVTLTAKKDMFKAVSDAGAHRAHTVSPASHTDTHKWLRFLGANHEAEMPKYGPNEEDYILFSWVKE